MPGDIRCCWAGDTAPQSYRHMDLRLAHVARRTQSLMPCETPAGKQGQSHTQTTLSLHL